MRNLLALFALALALAACSDDSSPTAVAATDTIPGPPNAPRLAVTVLTGTKAAPVDSPTVRVQWWYQGESIIFGSGITDTLYKTIDSTLFIFRKKVSGDTIISIGCAKRKEIYYAIGAQGDGKYAIDTVKFYCK